MVLLRNGDLAMKKALITGTSRGLGRALSKILTHRGYDVIATARRIEDIKDLDAHQKLSIDVTDENQVRKVAEECGNIDMLVNNAAYSVAGPLEDFPIEEIRKEYETNVIGPLRLIKTVLPGMRQAGSGTIVNISSVGDRFASPYGGSYSSAKAALAMMSEALRFEVKHFGIRVILVEAGAIKTDFALNQKQFSSDAYRDLSAQLKISFENCLKEDRRTQPKEVAKTIADAIESPDPGFRVLAGKDAEYMISLRSRMSDAQWEQSPMFSELKW